MKENFGKNKGCVKGYIEKLKEIARLALIKGQYEKSLECLSACANLMYLYNQEYTDDDIEGMLVEISNRTVGKMTHVSNNRTVVFYDGFGLDMRGLAQIYLKALIELDYKVIYITAASSEKEQLMIMSVLRSGNSKVYFLPLEKFFLDKLRRLRNILANEEFDTIFYYTRPNDVCGAVAFYELRGYCTRFQINLTDHAFWIGVNTFDYCIEFRDYGASISHYYRKIDKEKLIELPYYPYIDYSTEFEGFTFGVEEKKIVFSGGALYKTFDKDLTYYKLVEYIVKNHRDVIFVYAGYGNVEWLEKLVRKYPEQVYFIGERKDLFRVLEHSYVYLNTYPISGALMLQYAAKAKCLPVTLKRSWDNDASGILLNENDLELTFTEWEEVCQEIDKLIENVEYWNKKRAKLEKSIIEEKDFKNRLSELIREPKGSYMGDLEKVDTRLFRATYKENITQEDIIDSIVKKETKELFVHFPSMVARKIVMKVVKGFLTRHES